MNPYDWIKKINQEDPRYGFARIPIEAAEKLWDLKFIGVLSYDPTTPEDGLVTVQLNLTALSLVRPADYKYNPHTGI